MKKNQFDWDKHYAARVKMAGGDPDMRILSGDIEVPRYTMSDSGAIFDQLGNKFILEGFKRMPTKFE